MTKLITNVKSILAPIRTQISFYFGFTVANAFVSYLGMRRTNSRQELSERSFVGLSYAILIRTN